jgi:hypothetical protein
VFRIAEAKDGCKGRKSLQADRSLGARPKLDRYKGKDRNFASGPEKGARAKQALESQHCVWWWDWW